MAATSSIDPTKLSPEYLPHYADLKEQILLDLIVEQIESNFQRNVVTDRIVINCLRGILKATGTYPAASYISEEDGSLRLLFVIDREHKDKMDVIYTLLPQYQDLAIQHEGRDFCWQVALDEGLDVDFIRHDFDTIWTRKK